VSNGDDVQLFKTKWFTRYARHERLEAKEERLEYAIKEGILKEVNYDSGK